MNDLLIQSPFAKMRDVSGTFSFPRGHELTCMTEYWQTISSYKANKYADVFKGVLHLWALFLKTLCIFSKNKANLDTVSYGSGQKCSKELKNDSFTSVEAIVVKLQRKMCEKSIFSIRDAPITSAGSDSAPINA